MAGPVQPQVISGQAIGSVITVPDSTTLALLNIQGITVGSQAYNTAVGQYFKLTVSTASLVTDQVVAVSGISGLRWIIVSGSGSASPLSVIGNPNNSGTSTSSIPVAQSGGVTAAFQAQGAVPSGIQIWLIGDSLNFTDGTVISTWPDVSGFGNNGTATGSPVLKTGVNGINGHNAVKFALGSAGSTQFSGTFNPSAWAGLSVYYVVKTGATGALYSGVFGWNNSPHQWFGASIGSDPTQGAGFAGPTSGITFGGVAGYATNTPFFGSYRYDKANWTIEGVNTSTHADTSFPATNLTWLVGSNAFSGSQGDHEIAELIVYDRKLSDAEDAQNLAYIQAKYGFSGSASPALVVGYPPTIVNRFCTRFVHPSGNDANDGKTWQTAKFTVLNAWDSASAEIDNSINGSPNQIIDIHFHDLSWMGGSVANQGLWLYGNTNPMLPGWRAERPFHLTGHGGTPPGIAFTPAKARLYQGNPGDSQAFDLTKPMIWIEGAGRSTDLTIQNLQPVQFGFARLGVKADNVTRDGNLSNLWCNNVGMVSPPETAAVFGPAWDCGWLNFSWFTYCYAGGSSVFHNIAPNGTSDGASSGTSRITLSAASFSSTNDVGGYLTISAGPNAGQWFITSWVSATVVVVGNGPHALVTETFPASGEVINLAHGPQVIDGDDHAGWLFRPTPVSGGQPGEMGRVYMDNCSFNACGVKYYPGTDGECSLFVKEWISEGAPMPHPIHIPLMPGLSGPPVLVGQSFEIDIDNLVVADDLSFDNFFLYIDPTLVPNVLATDVRIRNMFGGIANCPCLWYGFTSAIEALHTTPQTQKYFGTYQGGRVVGRMDSGRFLGAPGTAMPSSTGEDAASPPHVTNLLTHNPTSWTALSGATLTANTEDVFGLFNACDIAPVTGSLNFTVNPGAPGGGAETWTAGDLIVYGVWVRALTPGTFPAATPGFLDSPIISASPTTGGGSFSQSNIPRFVAGNGEWTWYSIYGVYSGSTVSTGLTIVTGASQQGFTQRFCYPVALHLKASEGYTAEYAAELAAHMGPWNSSLLQGQAGTMRGQVFVGSGGIQVGDGSATTFSLAMTAGDTAPTPAASTTANLRWNATTGKIEYCKPGGSWTTLV